MTECAIQEITSTRLIPTEFAYLEPKSKAEALRMLADQKNIKVLAGGTDLLVRMKTAGVAPDALMNIKAVAELDFLKTEGGLSIGAATTLYTLEENLTIRAYYPALYESVSAMAGPAIRTMGTLAGNLCNASPAADNSPALLVLDASVVAERVGEGRRIPVSEFFTGPGKTVLQPDELLTEICIPAARPNSGSAYIKVGRVSGDIAKVNAAVYIERDGSNAACCRIALGAVAPTAIRVPKAEAMVKGAALTRELARVAARQASEEISPITDSRSTAWYRKQMAEVIVEDLLITAWTRSGGEPLK